MLSHPFLAEAIARLPIVDATHLSWCPTAATDGYTVYMNGDFMASLSDAEGMFVLAHEYLHVILGHGDRRGERDRPAWNMATDFATNQMLVEFGFEMPSTGLLDPRYRGVTAEAIYQALVRTSARGRVIVREEAVQRSGDGSIRVRGDGDASSGSSPEGLTRATARLERALPPDQRRRLVAQGGWDIQLEDGDPERAGGVPQGTLSELERRRLRGALTRSMRSEVHGRSASFLAEEIEAARSPQIAWEVLVAQFIGGLRRSDFRTFPFNRKHIHRGVYLPSLGTPGPTHLVVAIDTSGSINWRTAAAFLAEIDALRSASECLLTLLQCDVRIQSVEEFEPWDSPVMAESGSAHRLYGRGGTSFLPPFEWVDEQIEKGGMVPDALIYLTDGYGDFPSREPSWPVLWVISEDGVSNDRVPFGAVVRLPGTASSMGL